MISWTQLWADIHQSNVYRRISIIAGSIVIIYFFPYSLSQLFLAITEHKIRVPTRTGSNFWAEQSVQPFAFWLSVYLYIGTVIFGVFMGYLVIRSTLEKNSNS
jgi:uncharacterized membrane protein